MIRAALILAAGLLVVIVLALAGCASRPPPYVCVPVITSAGQSVIYCQPHVPSDTP